MSEGVARPAAVMPMTGEYIARHPKTGQPILGPTQKKRRRREKKMLSGPWSVMQLNDILDLATGKVPMMEVMFDGSWVKIGQPAGVRALPRLIIKEVEQMHAALVLALKNSGPEVRMAAIEALPICALRESEELLDLLAELLDDEVLLVRMAASRCLGDIAADFPSGTDTLLHIELRHPIEARRSEAWRGLGSLCSAWPDVAADHIDRLIREDDVELRRSAASLLRRLVNKSGAKIWDLISWSLQDEDTMVRRRAAGTLKSLAEKRPELALLMAESALFDDDEKVREKVVKCLDALDSSSIRLRTLISNGCKVSDVAVRKACINMIPRLYDEHSARELAIDLLKQERDKELKKHLEEIIIDQQLEGDEASKNSFLAPAEPVPARDLEILASMEEGPSFSSIQQKQQEKVPPPPSSATEQQDEMRQD